MDVKTIFLSLHPLERAVLPLLKKHQKASAITKESGMEELEVIRALQWLQNKNAVKLTTRETTTINLGPNGEKYRKQGGLPEYKLLEYLNKHSNTTLNEVQTNVKLTNEETTACIGLLRRKNAIAVTTKGPDIFLNITNEGKRISESLFKEDNHIILEMKTPTIIEELTEQFKLFTKPIQETINELRKRKDILRITQRKEITSELTSLGKELLTQTGPNAIEKITPELLTTGTWKDKEFRRFDVKANVPKTSGGRLHHYRSFLDSVRDKFISLGFKEMTGPIVESDFWDMDALYMPQFHSARDIHQAYYIKKPKYQEIDPSIIKRVKEVHEKGKGAKSKGWQYKFDLEQTKRTLLRSQATACSPRMLHSKELTIPGKYFAIARCFRHDVIDATHLPDFNQVEGFVIEEGLTIKHLIGLLHMLAKEVAGATEYRVVPGYFPFTEPSVELFAKHPQLGWIELGGAGLFRPEMVTPLLGKNISVIAWGLGVDRLGMCKLGIKDIRTLFSQDIAALRTIPVI